MASTRNSASSVVGIGALIITGCAVMLALMTFVFGLVTGYEFNPQTFERRMFGFYEIPLLRLQVLPLWRAEANGEVEELVTSTPYVLPEPNAPEQWHLISMQRSSQKSPPTDVQILARCLDAQDEHADSFWAEWSIKHPECATILWPEVARLARLELYVLMPPLFEAARNANDAKLFQNELKRLQPEQLKALGIRWQQRSSSANDGPDKAELAQRATIVLAAAATAEAELSKDRKPLDKPAELKPEKEAAAESNGADSAQSQ